LWGNRFDFVSTALARQNQQAKIGGEFEGRKIFACWQSREAGLGVGSGSACASAQSKARKNFIP